MTHDPELQDTIDHIGVHRLQQRYADIVNRRAWAEFDEIMRPDVAVRIDRRNAEPLAFDGPQAIATFIRDQIERFDFFEFVALNVLGVLSTDPDGARRRGDGPVADGSGARIRTHMCEVRRHGPDDPDAGCWSTAFGLYQDVVVRRDGRWRFAERSYRSLARTGTVATRDGLVFPPPRLRTEP